MLNVSDAPTQPLAVGVTITLAVISDVPLFIAVKDAMFPVPVVERPIEPLSLPQL